MYFTELLLCILVCILLSYFCILLSYYFLYFRFFKKFFFFGCGIKIETLSVSRRNKHFFRRVTFEEFQVSYVSALKMDLVRTIKHQRNDSRRESSGEEALGNGCSKTALIKPRLASFSEATVYECFM